MKTLCYRLYAKLSDGDVICIDELAKIKADHMTYSLAVRAMKRNARKIKAIKFEDDATIVAVSIVEVLLTDNKVETEEMDSFNISEL